MQLLLLLLAGLLRQPQFLAEIEGPRVLEPNDIMGDIIDLPAGRLLLQVPDLH